MFSDNAFQQSRYLKKNVDWRLLLKFYDFLRRGWIKRQRGWKMKVEKIQTKLLKILYYYWIWSNL